MRKERARERKKEEKQIEIKKNIKRNRETDIQRVGGWRAEGGRAAIKKSTRMYTQMDINQLKLGHKS